LGRREFVRCGPLVDGDFRDAATLDALLRAYRSEWSTQAPI
jgi:hypothetical protein